MQNATSSDNPSVDISELLLRSDIQGALVEVLEQLPKFAPYMKLAGAGLAAAKEVITDQELMGKLEEIVMQRARPMQQTAADAMSILKEAKQRAETGTEYIGVFGLLRLLKDPNVQYMLRFAQAFADVWSEHRHRTITPPTVTH